jgi:hypothetical protein
MAEALVDADAISIGVVLNAHGEVVRVINPDHEWQLDLVQRDLAEGETMQRVAKDTFGVSRTKRNAMTLVQVANICRTLGPVREAIRNPVPDAEIDPKTGRTL